jgi:hypothetical protein
MARGAGDLISRRLSPGLQPETRDAIAAEPFDSPDLAANPQPKIVNVRDAITAEVLDLPYVREKRNRGKRSPASSDEAIATGKVNSPGRVRKRGRVAPT